MLQGKNSFILPSVGIANGYRSVSCTNRAIRRFREGFPRTLPRAGIAASRAPEKDPKRPETRLRATSSRMIGIGATREHPRGRREHPGQRTGQKSGPAPPRARGSGGCRRRLMVPAPHREVRRFSTTECRASHVVDEHETGWSTRSSASRKRPLFTFHEHIVHGSKTTSPPTTNNLSGSCSQRSSRRKVVTLAPVLPLHREKSTIPSPPPG